MKKILIVAVIGVCTTLTAFTMLTKQETTNVVNEEANCKYGQCQKVRADYTQCKSCAQQYSSYCWSHKQ